MKKWPFWFSMFAVLLLNGASFYKASAGAMSRGIDGVDNQAGLLFIPILWIMAICALIALGACTLACGRTIPTNQKIAMFDLFHLSGRSAKEKTVRAAFIIMTCLLMLFAYSLFVAESIWAVSYALSGGALLLLLYAWGRAAVQASK